MVTKVDPPVEAARQLRNPTPLRYWPEYTACRAEHQRTYGVFIGTSQAIGTELADVEQTFFYFLREQLKHKVPGLDLGNWSVSGIRSDQIELLAMKAATCGAEHIFIVVSPLNLTKVENYRLGAGTADVDLLAGNPALWLDLADSHLFSRVDLHDILRRFLQRNSALLHSRERVLDVVARELPIKHHSRVIGHRRSKNTHLSAAEIAQRIHRLPFMMGMNVPGDHINPEHWLKDFERDRLPTFEGLNQSLKNLARRHDLNITWIWAPVNESKPDSELLAVISQMQSIMCRKMEAVGGHCIDLSRSLQKTHFLPQGIASHFSRQGQERFAEVMLPIIIDAVQ